MPGVREFLTGCLAVRLVSARGALNAREGRPFLEADGLAARAELVARLASTARQIAAVPLPTMAAANTNLPGPMTLALQLRRLGKTTVATAPTPPTPDAVTRPRARSRAS